ncbi:hypothetical protein Pta02_14190 [Planobispora takensis]|uniref:Uncharacterized protein n=1 Tax=Planobispora takensis TaxID=1367882 RepID=A0A8J3WRP7_9ACTN|nr:hypothetical protein Pta02_14190 [Planobispora takensis]
MVRAHVTKGLEDRFVQLTSTPFAIALYVTIDDWLRAPGRPARLGRLWLLPLAFALVLGAAPSSGGHPGRAVHHLGAGHAHT